MTTLKNVDFFVESIKQEDKVAVLGLLQKVFSRVMPNVASYVSAKCDWHESVLVRVEGKIAGCYMLKEEDLPYFPEELENTEKYRIHWRIGRGVHGIALAVMPEYRNCGIGKLLRSYPEKRKKYAYSFGFAFKSLNNIDHWLEYRRLIAETPGVYVTLRDHQPIGMASCHRYQTTAYDCGPSCIQIVHTFINKSSIPDHSALMEAMGCNPVTGTIGSGMIKGLDFTNIQYQRNPQRERSASYEFLNSSLRSGSPLIMRTLTHGAKHWTVVYGKNANGEYLLADPWLGLHTVSLEELGCRWEPRAFDGFSIV